MLTNLLGNAFKFTQAGEVVLCVTCAREEDSEIVLHFEIRDTDWYRAPAQTAFFGSSSQADSLTTRQVRRHGLGLAFQATGGVMGGEAGGTVCWGVAPDFGSPPVWPGRRGVQTDRSPSFIAPGALKALSGG
ncbi:MAG: hypothetical protein IPI57_07290 [Candidatus Competibacteraceae bacterium]|nr:hypothetical protein [Candidatus Competibacteraceae bacterium]